MSKLREMINHRGMWRRSAMYPKVELREPEHQQYLQASDADVYLAELRVSVSYQVPATMGPPARREHAKNAEDQLLIFLYLPLLEHIYALRSAVSGGDVHEAQKIIHNMLYEVMP